jgi:hypothetical protein
VRAAAPARRAAPPGRTRKYYSKFRLRGDVAAMLTAPLLVTLAAASAAIEPWPEPAVSFWFDASNPAEFVPLLQKVGAHKDAITSVILFCGVSVAPGGAIGGNISSACAAQLIPGLRQLGVKVEMTVESGTSDVKDYRVLFAADPQPLAERLAAMGTAHGISGWNMDLEPQKGTPASTAADALLYANWANKVRPTLRAAGQRFTADVADWGPMIAQYPTLATGFDRLMDMETYNAASFGEWLGRFQTFTNATTGAPLAGTSVGLGCWIDGTTNATGPDHWSATAASAAERICRVMNVSVPEVSFWVLSGAKGQDPEEFWWPALEKYMKGGGCAPPPMPPNEVCPASLPHSHRASPGGCCLASYTTGCSQACEQAACNATKGWHWKTGLNYSHDLHLLRTRLVPHVMHIIRPESGLNCRI